jgi:hypothetical protein
MKTNEDDSSRTNDDVRAAVRAQYGSIARADGAESCAPGCCGSSAGGSAALGYRPEDLAALPEGADLGLGCGNPQAIAALRPGETVLDLGADACCAPACCAEESA